MEKRESFSSKVGIVLATAGSAVGLGNLWAFPYRAGQNGGGTFVLIYIICVIAIGVPAMISEFIIGKNSNATGAINAFGEIEEKNNQKKSWFKLGGIVGIISSFLILSFYAVIAGWAVDYFLKGIFGGYGSFDSTTSAQYFETLIMSIPRGTIYQIIIMAATIFVVSMGVKEGIEKISKIMMPLLFLILLILVGYGFVTGAFLESVKYLFKPTLNLGEGNNIAKVAISAMGQAFMSLSLGLTCIITYGSYVDKNDDVVKISKQVAIADTMVALLAGLAIFPIVFANGLEAGQGPGLVFISLPIAFANMPLGSIIGAMFFLLIIIAALTSSISLLENNVAILVGTGKLTRGKATIIAGAIISVVGFFTQYGVGFSLPILNFTGQTTFLDQLDKLTIIYLIPISAFICVLFVGYRANYKLIEAEFKNKKFAKYFYTYLRYVVPIFITVIFVSELFNNIFA